jgi:hypothetical protein
METSKPRGFELGKTLKVGGKSLVYEASFGSL